MTEARTFVQGAALAAVVASLAVSACGVSSERIAYERPDGSAPGPTFVGPDGSVEPSAIGPDPVNLCPSSQCPPPFITCASSKFLCDVNSQSDNEHCGACDVPCDTTFGFRCSAGKCALGCAAGTADCDKILDNGCEVRLDTNDNCGGCGVKCAAGKKCVGGACVVGCPPPMIQCGALCVNPLTDDGNCGACGLSCNPQPPGLTKYPNNHHVYYGCGAAKCNVVKCDNRDGYTEWSDCNGDIGNLAGNGCEVDLMVPSVAHCGKCNLSCKAGQACDVRADDALERLTCLCGPTETNCGPDVVNDSPSIVCANLDADPYNCGACGRLCPGTYSPETGNKVNTPHAFATCKLGACGFACEKGYADCNGEPDDGCEVDLTRDPNHCGSCSNACAAGISQACVEGRCAVENCKTKEPL